MEAVGIFATIENSNWAQSMIRAARYPGNCWVNKAIGILARGDIDFKGVTPTGPEIRDRLAGLIGEPKDRHEMGRAIHCAQKHGVLVKAGTKRKSHEGREAYPEYHVIDKSQLDGTIDW